MATARVKLEASVTENGVPKTTRSFPATWSIGASGDKSETVSLTGTAFTALSPPSTAKAVLILIPQSAGACTLKGVTGDTGIVLSNDEACPVCVPLGSSPSIGIYNAGSTALAAVVWL